MKSASTTRTQPEHHYFNASLNQSQSATQAITPQKSPAANNNSQIGGFRLNDEACGTVATLRAGGLLRSKNVLVDKRFRRHDIGRSVLSLLWTMAMGQGLSCIGAFAAATTPGTHLYRGAGFSEVGGQVEYSLTR